MSKIENLSIQHIHNLYLAGTTTPLTLLLSLREQALQQQDFNAWITILTEDQIHKFCDDIKDESPQTLPLFGIPFAIKDNIDLANVPTTAACEDFKYLPESSSFVVQQLISAGAIPLGKTNLDQFATGLVGTRSPYGQGKNTFNPDYISGGSSAGSAIATALGQVSFALGTDTAGSGRVPAALNNLIGHKPTKGLISTTGVVPACKSLDCVSIFTLTAHDAAVVLEVASHYDSNDCYSRENIFGNSIRGFAREAKFKFGVPKKLDFFNDIETKKLYEQSIEHCVALGGNPIEIDFDPFIQAAKLLYEGPWVAERWLATQNVNLESMLPEIQKIIGSGNDAYASDCFAAQYMLATLKKKSDVVINSVDFILAPTTPTFFTRKEIDEEPIKNNSILGTYTNFLNLLDYTGTAVPIGLTDSGVPWGVTLVSQAFSDMKLLAYSADLQARVDMPLGATDIPYKKAPAHKMMTTASVNATTRLRVVVCGAHLKGQPLNWQLTERHAVLESETQTSDHYCLYVLPDKRRPALVRKSTGTNITVQVWSMPSQYYGSFVEAIPAPLGIGKIELKSGEWVSGFICDNYAISDTEKLEDISHFGGWQAWLDSK